MCKLFRLHRSGFYAWLKKPLSDITIEENRLLKLIKAFYLASGGIYGSSWIHRDLRDAGEQCSVNRVAKIMSVNKLQAQIGYERRILKADSILQSFLRQLCNLKRSLESRVVEFRARSRDKPVLPPRSPRRCATQRKGDNNVYFFSVKGAASQCLLWW